MKSAIPVTSLRAFRIVALCVAAIAGNTVALATESVQLAWNPSPDPAVAGYRVHSGIASRTYTGHLDVGNDTQTTVEGLMAGGTYYFAVTAYTWQGVESGPSGELVYTVPRSALAWLRILRGKGLRRLPQVRFRVPPSRAYVLQASGDLRSWMTVESGTSFSTNWIDWIDPNADRWEHRFYRLVLP